MKQDADYMATYVSELKKEIAKRESEKKEAAGKDDEDLITAKADAAIQYYNNELSWRESHAKELMGYYTERRTDRDQVVANETQRNTIQKE